MAASITTKLTGNGKNNIIYFVNLKNFDLTDTIGCPVVSDTPGGAQNGPKWLELQFWDQNSIFSHIFEDS